MNRYVQGAVVLGAVDPLPLSRFEKTTLVVMAVSSLATLFEFVRMHLKRIR